MQLPQRLGAFARSLAAVIVIAGAAPSAAQTAGGIPSLPGGFSLNDLPPDIQNQLRSQTESEAIPPTLGAEERAPRTVGPASAGPPQPSLLEEQYSRRADRPLTQVGYNIFRPEAGVTFREVGAVQDGYTLGTGDQLVVHMRGRVNRSVTIEVDREGMVVLPELPPIPATGTFGDFRRSLQQEAAQRMAGTDVFVSVARVREIAITMTGEVANPGVITLSGLGSLVDALRLSGGIKKTGSLRNVRIIRGGATITVDLYDFVLGLADSRDLALTNGDRVFVPVIGNTVAVAGQAKRPGIYELPAGTDALTSADLLELGGGVWVRGSYRYAALRVQPDGVEQLVNLARPSADMVRSGEILFVETATDVTVGSVTLSGHARLPGPYPLNAAGTVRTLLRGYEGLLADPYLPFAVVETADPRTRASRFEQFDLGAALSGRRDRRLMNADRVLLLGLEHVRFLSSTQVADALQGRPSGGRCAGLDFLARWVLANPNSDLASGQFATALKGLVGPRSGQVAAAERSLEGAGCPALYDQHPGLLTFALQNSIIVRGNVLNPGVYPVAGPDGINQVMELARSLSSGRQGGVQAVGATAELNRLAAERAAGRPASPPTRVAARPLRGSVADVVEVEEERVRLAGHVRFPGTRSLASARTVRDLIGDDSQFRENPYLLYGIILRRNPRTLMREVVPFSPADVLGGGDPVPLIDRDVVRIFGFEEVRAALQAVRQPAALPDGPAAQAGTETGGSMDMASGAPDGGAVTAPPGAAFGLPPTAAGQQQAPGGILAGGAAGGGGVPAPLAGHSLPEGGAPPAAAGADAAGAGATEASGEEGLLAYGVLTRLLVDASVELLGEVVVPGRYPIVGELSLDKVLSAAGGLAARADLSSVEITRFVLDPGRNELEVERQTHDMRLVAAGAIRVSPGTVVLVNPLISEQEIGLVEIRGEVKRPGRYGIVRGEKLSSLIQRAGGLQPLAYPTGAVFMRDSVRRAEANARTRAAGEFHRALIGRVSEPGGRNDQLTPEQVDLMTDLLTRLQSTDVIGRMVVEMNPLVLDQRPEFDVSLEGGDTIVIPRRPLSVFVSGEVFNPGAQQFTTTSSIRDYLNAAGGITDEADLSNAFIIRPNGSAERINLSVWGSGNTDILPGSWIVVPRNLAPFRLREFATTFTQILSQLAVSAASIAVISRN